MGEYKLTVGLEVHAELATKTKMFCSCKNDPDEARPNVNICPVCMGHPGTLPSINKEAVRSVLKVGIALGGKIAHDSEFDRKNYFYPDIPKGYQISQYKYPLVSGGELKGVKITRVHLEEDTAKSMHIEKAGADYSLVDFNRAGVPLMELVTEPVMHSGEEVAEFGQELQLLLQYLGVAEANMEKGEMRLEANISVSDSDNLGTKVEVKNLNSFRSAERAVKYELKRQSEILKGGGKIMQETRGWNDVKQETFSQRSKENSHDYRYFPDPDLPKLKLSLVPDLNEQSLSKDVRETPAKKRERFKVDYGIKESDINFYVSNIALGLLFEEAAAIIASKHSFQTLSNYIVSDLASFGGKAYKVKPEAMASLIKMINEGKLSSRGAKIIIPVLVEEGGEPENIADKMGLTQKSNESELVEIVQGLINNNPKVVEEYKAGKEPALQFLVGQGMKETKGSANPSLLKELILKLI